MHCHWTRQSKSVSSFLIMSADAVLTMLYYLGRIWSYVVMIVVEQCS